MSFIIYFLSTLRRHSVAVCPACLPQSNGKVKFFKNPKEFFVKEAAQTMKYLGPLLQIQHIHCQSVFTSGVNMC